MRDGYIDTIEALLLLGTFGAYLSYLAFEARREDDVTLTALGNRPHLKLQSVVFIALGVAAVLFGAHYTVEMVVAIAATLLVPLGLISISAIAIGTSLPELFVSIRAMKIGESELAIGNIFGSNAFNFLLVAGVPGIISPLVADAVVMELGLPIVVIASAILFVNGLAKQIMRWEGIVFLIFFAFFLTKLFLFCVSCVGA